MRSLSTKQTQQIAIILNWTFVWCLASILSLGWVWALHWVFGGSFGWDFGAWVGRRLGTAICFAFSGAFGGMGMLWLHTKETVAMQKEDVILAAFAWAGLGFLFGGFHWLAIPIVAFLLGWSFYLKKGALIAGSLSVLVLGGMNSELREAMTWFMGWGSGACVHLVLLQRMSSLIPFGDQKKMVGLWSVFGLVAWLVSHNTYEHLSWVPAWTLGGIILGLGISWSLPQDAS